MVAAVLTPVALPFIPDPKASGFIEDIETYTFLVSLAKDGSFVVRKGAEASGRASCS